MNFFVLGHVLHALHALPKILAGLAVGLGVALLLGLGWRYVQRVTATTDRMVACVEREEHDNVMAHDAAVRVCAVALQ